jgi:hypothetical protein
MAKKSAVKKTRKSAVKKTRKPAKKTAAKKAGNRDEMNHVVEPREGSVRAKLYACYMAAKKDVPEAMKLAMKKGVNEHTARKQLYLMARVGTKWTAPARQAAEASA